MNKNGRKFGFLAEAISIRDSVVPPSASKLSVVVLEVGQLLALPIGPQFKQSIGPDFDILDAAMTETVNLNTLLYTNTKKGRVYH